jgi:hypothetical protein
MNPINGLIILITSIFNFISILIIEGNYSIDMLSTQTAQTEWTFLYNCLLNGQNPSPPSEPLDRPTNVFANVDPRIAFVVSNLNPSLSSIQVASLASNRSVNIKYFF